MDAKYFVKNYWQYYIELEKQVLATQRYVAFDNNNYDTFSIEYIQLLQVICSEIEVVGKAIGQHFNPDFQVDRNTNINKWGYEVQKAFTGIQAYQVMFWSEDKIIPWKKWKYTQNKNVRSSRKIVLDTKAENPFWWIAYNSVKHDRTSIGEGNKPNYMRANLKAVVYALGALFVMEQSMLEKYDSFEIEGIEKSRAFRMISK